ncbi:hypothetical protein KAJ87_00365 [Candidatus Pacearchaeota archaeon]|nr:hypothetical protein [Candidatus Pacearchaeota archaeon]
MKRHVIIFLMLFSVIFLSNFILASDVAYITKNTNRVDSGFMNVFEEMGLEVDLIESKNVKNIDFSGYKFIFVGDERFRNAKNFPVKNYPSVIANGYYGKEFGLTNKRGASKLVSNSPLKVKTQESIIQVYNRAIFKFLGLGIPYSYLNYKYKKDYMTSIATTFVGHGKKKGDVISYSTQEPNKCFFGITKTKYWTEDAKNLFKECVNFVLEGSNYEENKTIEGYHDVEIIGDYSKGVNGIRIKDLETGEYILDEIAQLECNKKYKISFKTKNIGNFTENITFTGMISNFNWTSLKKNLEPGKTTTTGSKTINMTFDSGFYSLDIFAGIEEDISPENNFRSREVVCE